MNLPVLLLLMCSRSLFSSPAARPPAVKEPGCFKVNSCQCIMKDGSGVINLKAVGDAEGFLGHLRAVPGDVLGSEMFLSFSPCQQFSEPEEPTERGCSAVAACLIIRSPGLTGSVRDYVNYGVHKGNEFHYNHSLRVLSVSYFTAGEQLMTVVHYHCSPDRSASTITELHLGSDGALQVWVESPCACPNACSMGDLGLGSIFLIMLSLTAAAYFILGSCALRSFRSNMGMQLSVEHSVWCMICYLCSQGQPRKRLCAAPWDLLDVFLQAQRAGDTPLHGSQLSSSTETEKPSKKAKLFSTYLC